MKSKKIFKLPIVVEKDSINFDDLFNGKSFATKSSDIHLGEERKSHEKESISFSEFACWLECQHRHRLKYIDKIDLDGPSEHTEFGQVIHKINQSYIQTKTMVDFDLAKVWLTEAFDKLPNKASLKEKDWHDTMEPILTELISFLDTTFPSWEFVDAEAELFEPIDGSEKKFKGYIDAIIRTPKKNGSGWTYHILDWKTCAWGWQQSKKTDPKKTLQLVYYKIFWAAKHSIPLKDIKTGFILLKRTTKKERCEYVPVTAGPKTIEDAMSQLYTFLGSIKKNLSSKNRDSCTYCVYKKTPHCT